MKLEEIVKFVHEKDNEQIYVNVLNRKVEIWPIVRHGIQSELQFFDKPRNSFMQVSTSKRLFTMFNNCLYNRKVGSTLLLGESRFEKIASEMIQNEKYSVYNDVHRTPLNDIRFLNIIVIMRKIENSKEIKQYIKALNNEIMEKFEVESDFSKSIVYSLAMYFNKMKIFEKILRKNKISKIYVMPYTYHEFLTDLSESFNFEIVEIQHGIIDSHHVSYNFGTDFSKKYIPDKILLWDETFKKYMNSEIDSEVIEINKLNSYYDYYESIFISQYTVTNFLVEKVNEIAKMNPEKKYAFKSHPNENEAYRNYLEPNIDFFASEIEIMDLLQCTKKVYGGYSTSLYEAKKQNKEVYIYKEICELPFFLENNEYIKI